jgi:DNA-binding transcriptional LysR family regulator
MKFMHFRGLDLNLLVAFGALMRHRNVTRAAEDIRVTQSALSHALVRLRHHYHDPLFVRAKGAMNPTPRAMEIAGPIAEALQKVTETFGREFDHTSLDRTFRIGLIDYAAAFLLPALMERVGNDAPHAHITAEHMSFASAKRLLGTPEMDFAIGVCPSVPPSCSRELLFTEQFGVIARQNHSEIGRRLTIEKYAALRHVDVPLYRSIDSALRRHGVTRNFRIKSENILTIPFIVARSNLLATVPKGFALVFSQFCRLRVFDPPFKLDPYRIELVWHRRSQGDAAHAWFGGIIRSIAGDLRRDLRVRG